MRLIALLLLLGCLTILTGCSRMMELHPVCGQDIQVGDWCKEGWRCFSKDYVQYVMKVKIEEKAK